MCSIKSGKIPNLKHQITNKFQYLNSKQTLEKVCFEHWDFGIWYCLVFGIWSLGFMSPSNIEQLQKMY
jgi:hypothetical protein